MELRGGGGEINQETPRKGGVYAKAWNDAYNYEANDGKAENLSQEQHRLLEGDNGQSCDWQHFILQRKLEQEHGQEHDHDDGVDR